MTTFITPLSPLGGALHVMAVLIIRVQLKPFKTRWMMNFVLGKNTALLD
jgi:hypothetical protein